MTDINSMSHKIVQGLLQMKEDRGTMACLKKGLLEERSWKVLPIIIEHGWCPNDYDKPRTIILQVVGLFGMHPSHAEGVNFGKALRRLAFQRDSSPESLEKHKRYLTRLLACSDYVDLCERLGFIVRMMKNEGIPFDYALLYQDLHYWSDAVRVRWSKGYYNAEEREVTSDVSDSNNG